MALEFRSRGRRHVYFLSIFSVKRADFFDERSLQHVRRFLYEASRSSPSGSKYSSIFPTILSTSASRQQTVSTPSHQPRLKLHSNCQIVHAWASCFWKNGVIVSNSRRTLELKLIPSRRSFAHAQLRGRGGSLLCRDFEFPDQELAFVVFCEKIPFGCARARQNSAARCSRRVLCWLMRCA